MISFDVGLVSLFTAIPVDRACEHIRNKLTKDKTLQDRNKLSIDDIIKLLRFTLSNSYFIYNKGTNKFTVVLWVVLLAPLWQTFCMEEIEDLALSQSTLPPKKWFRYIDDLFSIIKRHALTNFYNLLNSIDPHINFTVEQEHDGKLSFLETLITRK